MALDSNDAVAAATAAHADMAGVALSSPDADAPHPAGLNGAIASGSLEAPSTAARTWPADAFKAASAVAEWFSRFPLGRFFSASLKRRILLANIAGLAGLLLAMLYLSLHHGWLLDAKVDVVKTVSRITAEAIAYRAVNERAVFDPDRLPERATPRAQRDDAFAALELPIDPQQAALVLKKLVGPTDLKARVYSQKGTLILDSDALFTRGGGKTDATSIVDETPRLKNVWTRIHYWLINKELKVYRELGTANGFLYPEVKRAAQEGVEKAILLLNSKGEQIVSMAEPIKRGNRVLGVLVTSTQPGDIDGILWDERWLIFQIAAIALLVAIGSSLLLAQTVAGPMRRLAAAANHVSRNIAARRELPDFSDRPDEVGQMGRAFIAMTGALYRRIEASEKFAADVAHELKNPLAAARSTAESLAYAKSESDRAELVAEIQTELKRLNRLINDVSNASRLDAELARQQMDSIDVRSVIASVSAIFADMLNEDGRKLRVLVDPADAAASYTVIGNDGRLGQVFTNLIDNALSFSPDGGIVTIRARPSGAKLDISVEDQGPGIPDDKLAAIFDRFYSDRPATDARHGKNSGLGLSISREIVASHRGQIFAENLPTKNGGPTGARFVVRLPLALNGGGAGGRRH
ncbi:MAG: stimulus-sensing domain-containing protein [Hyphomicrobium sp.]